MRICAKKRFARTSTAGTLVEATCVTDWPMRAYSTHMASGSVTTDRPEMWATRAIAANAGSVS